MLQLRRHASRVKSAIERTWERRRLAPLYSPDPENLDVDAHLAAAIAWLERAQDSGPDRGVAYGVRFGGDFLPSYPETSGYICRTFVEVSERTGDAGLLQRAIDIGIWESEIQLPQGAVMGGTVDRAPTPAIFNTGMVMLGWNALIPKPGGDRFERSCRRAADWLLRMQEADGNWVKGNSIFAAADATVYNVVAAWGLCEAGILLGTKEYIEAAIRNADFCLSRQEANGWFRDCCLTDAERPLLHTLAYTMQGLVEIGKMTGRNDFIEGGRRTAEVQMRVMDGDGFIAGRQDRELRPAVPWSCLTGSAQTSVVLAELHRLTSDDRYRDAAGRINRYLMARHDIRNPDLRLRGGLPGSWPTWGEYGRLMVLSWGTKFLIDALSREVAFRQHGASMP